MWDTKTFLLRLRHWQLVALHLIQFLKCHRKTACSNSCELVWTEDQFTDFVTAKNIGSISDALPLLPQQKIGYPVADI